MATPILQLEMQETVGGVRMSDDEEVLQVLREAELEARRREKLSYIA